MHAVRLRSQIVMGVEYLDHTKKHFHIGNILMLSSIKDYIFMQWSKNGCIAKTHGIQKPGINGIHFSWVDQSCLFGTGVKWHFEEYKCIDQMIKIRTLFLCVPVTCACAKTKSFRHCPPVTCTVYFL